jgi:hypothetical protein
MSITLQTPPSPDDGSFKNNPLAYNRAIYQWMNDTKSKIEKNSQIMDSPLDQNFVISSFSTNTQLTGTSSGTDISNFICTLVAAFTRKNTITAKKRPTG